MRNLSAILSLSAVVALAACQKTGEGEYKMETPDVDVSTDTTTVRTPSIDVGKDTVTMTVPDVNVMTPAQRDSAARAGRPPSE